jgi:AcrR family transcriptional regulator
VEEIAERADVGKGTVFNYFPQKTDFLLAAYQEWVGIIWDELGPVESWEGPARVQLFRVFSYLAGTAVEHRPLSRLVILENMRETHLRMAREDPQPEHRPPESPKGQAQGGHIAAVRLLEDMTREVIRKGRENGEIRPEIEDRQAASLIAASVFHTLVRGLVLGASVEEIQGDLETKMDIIFTGLAP